MRKKVKKSDNLNLKWYDCPSTIITLLIIVNALIIIFSQSLALKNGLSILEILGGILNHNSIIFLILIYSIFLKTRVGKKYFDYSNVFLILIYFIISITSSITLIQSFSLSTLLCFLSNIFILLYLIHTMLRNTTLWKNLRLDLSPFNEISNNGYFYTIFIIEILSLTVNLILTTSFEGSILAFMDFIYLVLFIRYIYLYGIYLNSKNIDSNNKGNFDKYRKIVSDFAEENNISDTIDDINDKLKEVGNATLELIDDAGDKIKKIADDNINFDSKDGDK